MNDSKQTFHLLPFELQIKVLHYASFNKKDSISAGVLKYKFKIVEKLWKCLKCVHSFREQAVFIKIKANTFMSSRNLWQKIDFQNLTSSQKMTYYLYLFYTLVYVVHLLTSLCVEPGGYSHIETYGDVLL